ncbi:MAG TPA: hypothetical protein VJ673_10795 [Aromatoleum sp.]|uniref:hypothetical protein n=1 Tax=Aromatoleum sp. TaxID=2307007 RepID=UPI002B46B920|nr:hypothetical protein [Aromatoleum sp.]HJV26168.1 hypothetical protein [Aromatoleum sp.]
MKHPLHPLAALLMMCAGIGSGCAEEGGDAAFLSGGRLSSAADAHAAHEAAAEMDDARSRAAKSELLDNGAHFSRTEYLFLTGAAFYSGPEGYPLSW